MVGDNFARWRMRHAGDRRDQRRRHRRRAHRRCCSTSSSSPTTPSSASASAASGLPEANSLLAPAPDDRRAAGPRRAPQPAATSPGARRSSSAIAKAAHPPARSWPRPQPTPTTWPTARRRLDVALVKRLVYEFLGETDREPRRWPTRPNWTWWTGAQPDIVEAMTARMESARPVEDDEARVPDKKPEPED